MTTPGREVLSTWRGKIDVFAWEVLQIRRFGRTPICGGPTDMTKVMSRTCIACMFLHVLRHAEQGVRHARRDKRAADFWGPGPPKGSKILGKAAMLAADCRPAGLEGLED